MEKFRTLIIPDVHGRDFWREPVNETLENSDARIIFLGDYVDPYPYEWENVMEAPSRIDFKQKAFDTLVEVIELKKKYPKRITLLLGNHDYGYINDRVCSCRRDSKRYVDIHKVFMENRDCFLLADEERVNDKHIIYSHAGISKKYAQLCFGDIANEDNVVDLFNNAYLTKDDKILRTLEIYDYYRGWGGDAYASLVWADVREWETDEENEDAQSGYGYMIFGHSQLENEPIIGKHVADLDCRKAFILDDEGNIKEYLKD